MFYYVNGELALTEPGTAVIDCAGVGYKLTISNNTLGALSSKLNQKVKLFTHLAVREDGIELFGFAAQAELSAFRMLITVSGVGPKAAMAVLSSLSPEKFAMAVTMGDAKLLSKTPGVGAKTSARIILELKDKIAKDFGGGDGFDDDLLDSLQPNNKLADAQDTLLVLGYTRSEAIAALRKIDTVSLGLEDIIKEALKKLMRN